MPVFLFLNLALFAFWYVIKLTQIRASLYTDVNVAFKLVALIGAAAERNMYEHSAQSFSLPFQSLKVA